MTIFQSDRPAVEELRREIERLREFVELRATTQENLMRAMLAQSTRANGERRRGIRAKVK